jgi:hypothetical protein
MHGRVHAVPFNTAPSRNTRQAHFGKCFHHPHRARPADAPQTQRTASRRSGTRPRPPRARSCPSAAPLAPGPACAPETPMTSRLQQGGITAEKHGWRPGHCLHGAASSRFSRCALPNKETTPPSHPPRISWLTTHPHACGASAWHRGRGQPSGRARLIFAGWFSCSEPLPCPAGRPAGAGAPCSAPRSPCAGAPRAAARPPSAGAPGSRSASRWGGALRAPVPPPPPPSRGCSPLPGRVRPCAQAFQAVSVRRKEPDDNSAHAAVRGGYGAAQQVRGHDARCARLLRSPWPAPPAAPLPAAAGAGTARSAASGSPACRGRPSGLSVSSSSRARGTCSAVIGLG